MIDSIFAILQLGLNSLSKVTILYQKIIVFLHVIILWITKTKLKTLVMLNIQKKGIKQLYFS